MVKKIVLSLLMLTLAACSSGEKATNGDSASINTEDVPFTEVKSAYQNDIQVITPLQLSGVWRSEKPEPSGNGRYAVRELSFNGSRWEMTYTMAADKNMKEVLFTHKASGTLRIQSPSKRISGAYLISYGFNHKTLNIMTNDKITLKELGFETCSIPPKQDVDVTSRGCGIIPRVGECPNDYDLLRQENRKGGEFISLGNKFAEFSACSEDKRPVALGFSLIKVK